jgi:hypothetical protein
MLDFEARFGRLPFFSQNLFQALACTPSMGKHMGNFVERSINFERTAPAVPCENNLLTRLCKRYSWRQNWQRQLWQRQIWQRQLWHRWRQAAVACTMAGTALCGLASAGLAQDSRNYVLPSAENLSVKPAIEPAVEYSAASDLESVPLFHGLAQQSLLETRSPFSLGTQQAQEESDESSAPLQSEMTPEDQQVMEELVSIAVSNAPAVRDARAAMGVAPFLDAFVVEIAPSRISSTLSDASVQEESYGFSDSSTTSTFTFNPVQLINGIQQMPALQSHLRDAEQQTRVSVVQSYVAYVQARQTATISSRQLDTVVATILQESQIASADLEQVPINSVLANNDDYIAAATESLVANSDEMVALETLAATVGMPTQDMLTVIEGVVTQVDEAQPTAAVDQTEEEQPSPAVLVVDRDRD